MSEWDERVAYHEAGHAVAWVASGFDVVTVTIVEGENGRGHTEAGPRGMLSSADAGWLGWVETAAIVVLAGPQSEYVRFGSLVHPDGNVYHAGDDRHLTALLQQLDTVDPKANLPRIRRQTRELVDREWASIVAVASALMEHKTLSGDDVVAIRCANGVRTAQKPAISEHTEAQSKARKSPTPATRNDTSGN